GVATPLNCDDLNPCTQDICNPDAPTPVDACQHLTAPLDGTGCNDNNACTDVDTCAGGKCVGVISVGSPAAICNAGDGDVCDGIEHCNTATGACEATALNCDDANPCTTDSCNAINGCMHSQITGLCDDGNACTTGDECVNGACLGAPTSASQTCAASGNACTTGAASCDPGTGTCVTSPPLDCDDGDACTTDTCDPVSGCSNPSIDGLDGALCEIDAILDQLRAARPPTVHLGKLVSRRLVNRLRRLTLQARVKVEFASRASNPRAVKLLTGADKKL